MNALAPRMLLVFWIAFSAIAGCSEEPLFERELHKARLIDDIRHALLQSVESEKSAVLATTDKESEALADQSRGSTKEVNQLLDELRTLITQDAEGPETEKLAAFESTWSALQKIDQRLLVLAVANTNLKAARTMMGEGGAVLDRLIDVLDQLEKATAQPDAIRTISRASVATLRIHSTLLLHIPAAEDAEMTRMEQQIEALSDAVDGNLSALRESSELPADQLAAATEAWGAYRRIGSEVLRLSRENSNVISFDVSVHEKRYATRECLLALAALRAEIDPTQRATR